MGRKRVLCALIGAVIWLGLWGKVYSSTEKKDTSLGQGLVYQDEGRRDPFWPLVNQRGAVVNYDKELQMSDMTLEGVVMDPRGNNAAIINGQIVSANEQVGVFIVSEILADSVVLQNGEETFVLKMKKKEE